jgi:hypothetical protein
MDRNPHKSPEQKAKRLPADYYRKLLMGLLIGAVLAIMGIVLLLCSGVSGILATHGCLFLTSAC